MSKKQIRDVLRCIGSIVFFWLYIPHMVVYYLMDSTAVDGDLEKMKTKISIRLSTGMTLLYLLHTNAYFRTLFYHRVGAVKSLIIGWYRPGDKYFQISKTTKIGKGMLIVHPYATILNAESIGENFDVRHLTTLGDKNGRRPVIGNNVTLGVAVTIVGGVKIGDNVVIGAGSIVTKDIPDNCIAVGNPAKVIRTKSADNIL